MSDERNRQPEKFDDAATYQPLPRETGIRLYVSGDMYPLASRDPGGHEQYRDQAFAPLFLQHATGIPSDGKGP